MRCRFASVAYHSLMMSRCHGRKRNFRPARAPLVTLRLLTNRMTRSERDNPFACQLGRLRLDFLALVLPLAFGRVVPWVKTYCTRRCGTVYSAQMQQIIFLSSALRFLSLRR